MSKYALTIVTAITGFSLLMPFVTVAQGNTDYCMQGSYGYNVRLSAGSYLPNQHVEFCLRDDTRNPMFLGTMNPWIITDMQGNTVYQPSSGSSNQPSPLYYGNWNQTDQQGRPVAPGMYTVVFMVNGIRTFAPFTVASPSSGMLFSASDPHTSEPVDVLQGQSSQVNQIIYSNNNRPVTVLIDMEIKDSQNHMVSQAYFDNQLFGIEANQLYSVSVPPTLPVGDYTVNIDIFQPGWNGLIQWINDVHTFHVIGSGASSSIISSARSSIVSNAAIEPINMTVRSGTTIDFTGRNFGIEEPVTVTSDGKTVTTAHADGGGNFSTGSLFVPATTGSKTYTFTGLKSGITLSDAIMITP